MIELTEALDLLTDVRSRMERLNGTDFTDRDAQNNPAGTADRAQRRTKAALSRELLFTVHRLHLAASLVHAEYWTAKGYDDSE